MISVLYGMPPRDAADRGPYIADRWYRERPAQTVDPTPATPETGEALTKRLQARIAWLENELRMHDAWRLELATLKRMLDAAEKGEP